MTSEKPDPGSGLPATTTGGTEIELSARLDAFGVLADVSAKFGPGKDTVLSFRLRNLTVGEIISFLVDLAEPGLGFELPPPWDLLGAIRMDDLTFELDVTTFRVGFRYDNLGLTFPLVDLEAIEVWYTPRPKSVDVSLFGTFLGQDLSTPPGLSWDVLSQPAPAVPGQGPKYFDLEYLGAGQSVVLRDVASLPTVTDVVAALEQSYRTPDPRRNPLETISALRFDPGASWLFGAKFSVLQTVTLSVVFNDPVLYGARVALDGAKAKALAGLRFEILYRKINDHIGVYHVELQLPDSLRKQQYGEATITFPVIDLDVYTNGDFLLDLGFPHNGDFSRSFAIEFIVWIGPVPLPVSAAGGFYFGVLSGETSTAVPAVTNGHFTPVIAAGFGILVGLGKSVSIGPLDAGFFAGFQGIFEGVLAWFHPDSPDGTEATFFSVRGTVGIVIHIWGRIDFAVLQASLDIYAYAMASVSVTSHQPIEVGFSAGISVELSIKVLFFTIHLSFSATISESFTIGQASPTPWTVGPGPAGSGPRRELRANSGGVLHAAPRYARLLESGLSWTAAPAELGADRPALALPVWISPMLTAARRQDMPGATDDTDPSLTPAVVVTLLVGDRGDMAGAILLARERETDEDVPLSVAGDDGTARSTSLRQQFPLSTPNRLDAVLDWAGQNAATITVTGNLAAPNGCTPVDDTPVTAAGESLAELALAFLSPAERFAREALYWVVESLHRDLAAGAAATSEPAVDPTDPVTRSALQLAHLDLTNPATPVTLPRVVDFLTSRGITLDLAAAPAQPDSRSVTAFPVPPWIVLDGTVDFGAGPPVDAAYLARIADLVGQAPSPTPTTTASGAGTQPAKDAAGASLPGALFADYVAYLFRSLTQAGMDALRSVSCAAAPGDSLVAVAARYGLLPTGAPLDEQTLSALARANAANPAFFAPGVTLQLCSATTTVQDAENLRALAARLQAPLAAVATALADDPAVLAGGTVTVGTVTREVTPGDSLSALAAALGTDVVTLAGGANATALQLRAGHVVRLGVGTEVRTGETPGALAGRFGLAATDLGRTLGRMPGLLLPGTLVRVTDGSYVPRTGDTLPAVAAAFGTTPGALIAANPGASWNPAPGVLVSTADGGPLRLPRDLLVPVLPGDTLESLARRCGSTVTGVLSANADVADLLQPATPVTVPPGRHAVAAETVAAETPADVAARYGLTLVQLVSANAAPDPAGSALFATVVVPDAEQMPLEELMGVLLRSGALSRPARGLSRFLLGGLRLPPLTGTAPGTRPLAALTGQQVDPPASGRLTFSVAPARNGQPQPGVTVPPSVSLDLPVATVRALCALPPAGALQTLRPPAVTRFPPYVVGPRLLPLGAPRAWSAVAPRPLVGPADPLPAVPSQPSAAPALPPGGTPSLHPFPAPVRDRLAAAHSRWLAAQPGPRGSAAAPDPGTPLVLQVSAKPTDTTASASAPLTAYGWGTHLRFSLRRIPDSTAPGEFLDGVYEVVATDQDAAGDLGLLLEYLHAGGPGRLDLYVLRPADPAGGTALASDAPGAGDVLLVKANLTTVSAPPAGGPIARLALEAPSSPYAADLSDGRGFLLLLWEALVTNSGGFYLRYSVGGTGLPPAMFSSGPTAEVGVLATLGSAGGVSGETVPAQAFHTTAVVFENLPDPTATLSLVPARQEVGRDATLRSAAAALGLSLPDFVQANATATGVLRPGTPVHLAGATHTVRDGDTLLSVTLSLGAADVRTALPAPDTDLPLVSGAALEVHPDWVTAQPTMAPDVVGFCLRRDDEDFAPDAYLAPLFHMLGFSLEVPGAAPGGPAVLEGLPVGPTSQPPGPSARPGSAAGGPGAGASPPMWTKQVQLPRDASSGPYVAVGQDVALRWHWRDVFGNRVSPDSAPEGTLALPRRYTDQLIGVGSWPATTATWSVTSTDAGPYLGVHLGFDAGSYVAPAGEPFTPVTRPTAPAGPAGSGQAGPAGRAAANRDRFTAVAWQLRQRGTTASLSTSLSADGTMELPVDALRGFVTEAAAYLDVLAGTTQVTVPTTGTETLSELAGTWQVPTAELAAVNRSAAQNADAAQLLAPVPLTVPHSTVPSAGETLAGLATRAAQAVGTETTPAQLATANRDVRLRPGSTVVLARMQPLPTGTTFSAAAATAGRTVGQLAAANASVPGLIAVGAGVTLTPPGSPPPPAGATPATRTDTFLPGDTLAGVAARNLVELHQLAAALVAAGATLGTPRVAVPVGTATVPGETLRALAGRLMTTLADLAVANADVAGLLAAGATLRTPDGEPLRATGTTLAALAEGSGLLVGDLAAANPDVPVGAVTVSASRRTVAADTLGTIAAAGSAPVTVADLGEVNALVPNLFAGDEPVLLGTSVHTVLPGETLADVATATGTDLAVLAAANADLRGLFAPGQTLAVPRHVHVPSAQKVPGAAPSFAALAATTHRAAGAIGLANADVTGLLRPGVAFAATVSLPGRPVTVRATTAAAVPGPEDASADTLSTLAARLAGQVPAGTVSLAQLVEANADVDCLVAGAAFLVPPADVGGPAGSPEARGFGSPVTTTAKDPLIPVTVSLTIDRPAELVDPSLAGTPEVGSAATELRPDLRPAPGDVAGPGGEDLALRRFGVAFEAAFAADSRKLLARAAASPNSGTGTPRLMALSWQVPASSWHIDGTSPTFFAPPPLSTAPWSSPGPVLLPDYETGGPPAPDAVGVRFTGIDLDSRAREFLALLDRVLGGELAVDAHLVAPDAYDRIVSAKGALAGAIGSSVTPVLAGGPPGDRSAAAETFRQQLLVELSRAYSTDVLVQLPVSGTLGGTPPGSGATRLLVQSTVAPLRVPSGRPQPGETVAAFAGRTGASVAGFIAGNQYVPGLFAPGSTVTVGGRAVTIGQDETLRALAARLQVTLGSLTGPLAPLPLAGGPDLHVPGTTLSGLARVLDVDVALLAGLVAGEPALLAPGYAVPGSWTCSVAPGDTFASVARRLGRTVAELADAAAATPGVLVAGTLLTTPAGRSRRAAPSDTLAGLAGELGSTPADLAAEVATLPDSLTAGIVLPLPQYVVGGQTTLSAAADRLATSVSALAGAIADDPAALAPGAPLRLAPRSYTTIPGDNLSAMLGHLAVDVTAPGDLQLAIDVFAALNGDVALFAEQRVLEIPLPVEVEPGDTLQALAARRRLTLAEVAVAVADRTDLLVAGSTVRLPFPGGPVVVAIGAGDSLTSLAHSGGLTLLQTAAALAAAPVLVPGVRLALPGEGNVADHAVGAGETLAAIAATVGSGVDVPWLVTTQLHAAGVVHPGTTVRFLGKVSGYTIGGGEFALSGAPQTVTLPFRSATNTEVSHVRLDLQVQADKVRRVGQPDLPWAPGYETSDWLSFIVPPADEQVGTVDVPIPLRAFPVPPSVTAQSTVADRATAPISSTDTLADVLRHVGNSEVLDDADILSPGARLELPDPLRIQAGQQETVQRLSERVDQPVSAVLDGAVRSGLLPPSSASADDVLPSGAWLTVPDLRTVAAGDTLRSIATAVRSTPAALVAANAGRSGLLRVGVVPAPPAAATLQELRHYTYRYSFNCRRTAQDVISVSQHENVLTGPAAPVAAPGPDARLATALAWFSTVRPRLEQDLALLPTAARDPEPATSATVHAAAARRAITALAVMAQDIAAGWGMPAAGGPGGPGVRATVPGPTTRAPGAARYTVHRTPTATGGEQIRLVPDGETATRRSRLPSVTVPGARHHPVAAGHVRLTRLAAAAPGAAAPPSAGPDVEAFDLSVPGRDLMTVQNIWGDVSLQRNTSLLPGVATDPAFIYSVAGTRLPSPAVPLLSLSDRIEMAGVGSGLDGAGTPLPSGGPEGRRPLVDWLIGFFDSLVNQYTVQPTDTLDGIAELFGITLADLAPRVVDRTDLLVPGATVPVATGAVTIAAGATLTLTAQHAGLAVADLLTAAGRVSGLLQPGVLLRPRSLSRRVRVAVDYGFPLATGPDGEEILSRTPVVLVPTFLLSGQDDLMHGSGFCAGLAATLQAWTSTHRPPPDLGRWVFDVSAFTTLPDPHGAPAVTPGDPAHEPARPPLLELTDVQLPLSLLTDPATP